MKKAIILILIFASLLCFNVRAHLGSFYDGTGSRDSVWIPVATFDTLGYELNADSLWVWRFFRADTIDMTVKVSNDSTRRGYFLFGKRAVDSTAEGKRYGGYTVKIRWKVQGKYFHKSESYTVFPDSVTGVGRVTTLGDKTGYTATLSDKSDYLLKADSNVVARAPWDNDLIAQANRRIQYADSLGEEITGGSATNPDTIANHVWIWGTRTLTSGSGSGTNQVTVYTFQSSDSTPIEDVQVQMLNQGQTSTVGLLNSDSFGKSVFAQNDGIYKLRMKKSGWQFTVPESIIVSGNTAGTFYADIFNPGSPPLPELCRVYGWIQDLKGEPVVGATVEAKLSNSPLRYQTVLLSPYYKTTATDSYGYWSLDLYPNSKLIPPGTQYDFTIYIPYGTILRLKVTVPEQSSWELVW